MSSTAAPAKPEMLELVSRHKNHWISLETNLDDYNSLGGMRTVRRGTRVRFSNGRAKVSADLRDAVEAHPNFGLSFFWAEDPRAALQRALGGPQVVSGQLRASLPASDNPPLPDWDTMGPREIREALESGRVADLQGALMWEGAKRARAQVLATLGKAIRTANGGSDEDSTATSPSPEAAGLATYDDDEGDL